MKDRCSRCKGTTNRPWFLVDDTGFLPVGLCEIFDMGFLFTWSQQREMVQTLKSKCPHEPLGTGFRTQKSPGLPWNLWQLCEETQGGPHRSRHLRLWDACSITSSTCPIKRELRVVARESVDLLFYFETPWWRRECESPGMWPGKKCQSIEAAINVDLRSSQLERSSFEARHQLGFPQRIYRLITDSQTQLARWSSHQSGLVYITMARRLWQTWPAHRNNYLCSPDRVAKNFPAREC